MSNTDLSNDPANYRVEHVRDASGALRALLFRAEIFIHPFECTGEDLERLLRGAREVEDGDPRGDKLACDRALIIAMLLDHDVEIPDHLMTLEAPPTGGPTRDALEQAVAGLIAAGWPPKNGVILRLQAMLDQRGCEDFDAAGDGSLTDLIDIIIDG